MTQADLKYATLLPHLAMFYPHVHTVAVELLK